MNIPKSEPWYPVEITSQYARICQAIREGNATEEQQQKFMNWLLNDVCAVNDLEFRPDSDRATVFASGRRFVGMQIRKHLLVSIGALDEKEKGEADDGRSRSNRRSK